MVDVICQRFSDTVYYCSCPRGSAHEFDRKPQKIFLSEGKGFKLNHSYISQYVLIDAAAFVTFVAIVRRQFNNLHLAPRPLNLQGCSSSSTVIKLEHNMA